MTENRDPESRLSEAADKASDKLDEAVRSAGEMASEVVDKARDAGDKLEEKFRSLEKLTPKELGDLAVKVASDTAFAAAGVANLVAERAREFADKQKAALVDTQRHTEAGEKTHEFLEQLSTQLTKFVDDLSQTYKDLADRGREALQRMQAQSEAKADAPKGDDAPGPFDINEAADTAEPASTVAEDAEIVDAPAPAPEAGAEDATGTDRAE